MIGLGSDNKIFYPSISSIYLWSPFNKLYAIHKRFVVNQFVCFQQIFLDDEVLKVLNILKLDAVVFVGTTWEQCPAWPATRYFYRTRVRSLFTLVSNSLTDSCLVNLIDVTQACEDANSKLVDVVTIAGEDRVGNNLLQILKLRFGKKKLNYCSYFEH